VTLCHSAVLVIVDKHVESTGTYSIYRNVISVLIDFCAVTHDSYQPQLVVFLFNNISVILLCRISLKLKTKSCCRIQLHNPLAE